MFGDNHLPGTGLVFGGRRVAERGVTPLAVVPDLDELEDR